MHISCDCTFDESRFVKSNGREVQVTTTIGKILGPREVKRKSKRVFRYFAFVQVFSFNSQQDSQKCLSLLSPLEQKCRKSCIIFFWNNSSPADDSDFHLRLTMWFQDHKNPIWTITNRPNDTTANDTTSLVGRFVTHPPVHAVIIFIFATNVSRDVRLVRTRLVRMNWISFLYCVTSNNVGAGSWTRSSIRCGRYQYECVAGDVNVLMIVFGVLD